MTIIMKKIISYLLIISTILFLAGCSNESGNENTKTEKEEELEDLSDYFNPDGTFDDIKFANTKIIGTWVLSNESIEELNKLKNGDIEWENFRYYEGFSVPDILHFSADGTGYFYKEKLKDVYAKYGLENEPIKWEIKSYKHYPQFTIDSQGQEIIKTGMENSIIQIRSCPEPDQTPTGYVIDWSKEPKEHDIKDANFYLTEKEMKLSVSHIFDIGSNKVIYNKK